MCNNLGKEGMYIMIYCIMITLLPRVIITEALVMELCTSQWEAPHPHTRE